jgi:hypothetical protein
MVRAIATTTSTGVHKMSSKLVSFVIAKILPYLLAVAGLFSWSLYQYNLGYRKATAEYEKAAYNEELRVSQINRDVRAAAEIVEQILQQRIEAQDEQIKRLSEEAAQDVDAGNQSNSADSVRRLNQVR